MNNIKDVIEKMKHGPSDVVGLDIGNTCTKVVRLRKSNDVISVVSADILPKVEIPAETPDSPAQVPPLQLPPKLKGRYGSLAVTGSNAVIKLLSFPGAFDAATEAKVVGSIGLDNPDNYRISYKVITEGHGKSESRILAVALLESETKNYPMLLPSGLPAPFSLEISGLATMTAFLHSAGKECAENAVGLIDFGATTTSFALFNKGILALVRRFNFGLNALLDNVQQSLGVDRETAQGIVSDGSFDISQSVSAVVEPLIKQLIVSRDFVERRENCHISKMYVSGGLTASRDSLDEIRSAMSLDVVNWNPLDGLTLTQGTIPDTLTGKESCLSAAIGAALATLEEK